MEKQNYKQPIIGLILILFLFCFALFLGELKLKLQLFAGIMLGYTLTRSRYGFAGGIKRIYMRGEGSLSKALLLLLAFTSILFFVVQMNSVMSGAVAKDLAKSSSDMIIPGTQNVYFTGLSTIIGGIIFGMGMILAGGCGSGTLADFGEGQGRALIAFIFFVIGSGPGYYFLHVFEKTSIGKIGGKVYLPDYLGHWGALFANLIGFLILYLVVIKYENMRKKEATYLDPKGDYEDFEKPLQDDYNLPTNFDKVYHKLFVERWSFVKGSLILTMGAVFVIVATGKPWGVSTPLLSLEVAVLRPFINFSPEIFGKFLDIADKGLLKDGGTIRNIGLFFGSTIAFLLARRFKIDFDFKIKDALYFALGGFMLGFGARLGRGCNVGAMYSAVCSFSLSGWVFLFSMSLGAVIALKVFAGKVCIISTMRKDQLAKK